MVCCCVPFSVPFVTLVISKTTVSLPSAKTSCTAVTVAVQVAVKVTVTFYEGTALEVAVTADTLAASHILVELIERETEIEGIGASSFWIP